MRCRSLLLFLLLSVSAWLPPARADSLDQAEQAELKTYLAELKKGRPCSPAMVERLASVSWPGLRLIMETYADLDGEVEPHTQRAFQVFLERTSREAGSPWPMITLYSPDLASFLTASPKENPLAGRLFDQLRRSDAGRQAFDLAVRLTPTATLRHLSEGVRDGRTPLFAAWNRRLALARERRPLPGLEESLDRIARSFKIDLPPEELEAHLRFLASWPTLEKAYGTALEKCLKDDRTAVVQAALAVQHRAPRLLELNEGLVQRWSAEPKLVELVLRNYAFDERRDHSATLRQIWATLPAKQVRLRYECLFAMGSHWKGNDAIALQAVLDQSYELIDVALQVLRHGDPEKAHKVIGHILRECDRGHEEALRLATELRLTGFEADAVRIAQDKIRDQILRQTALLYLQRSDGGTRRKLLPLLTDSKADLRLTAIRMFAGRDGLSAEDMNEIGPSLIRVALADPSMGHRQEAIYAVGCWKAKLATEFFRKILADNPTVTLRDSFFNDERYWQYRFHLMGLLGSARLGDAEARKELLDMHHKGGPTERMDVLLAFLDLREAPEEAYGDLSSTEPKLIATAATLIARHGDEAGRERMRRFFQTSPLWREFQDSGIDDHNILRIAGLKKND
jgi:hypothetical protein